MNQWMNLLKLFQIFDGGCLESNLVMEIGFKKLLLYLVSFEWGQWWNTKYVLTYLHPMKMYSVDNKYMMWETCLDRHDCMHILYSVVYKSV